MTEQSDFIEAGENFLAHFGIIEHKAYQERNYNPAKAHEYYMRTRKLKPKRNTGSYDFVGRQARIKAEVNRKKKQRASRTIITEFPRIVNEGRGFIKRLFG